MTVVGVTSPIDSVALVSPSTIEQYYLHAALSGLRPGETYYYAVGHESNDNYISMISGQAPSAQNQADCQFYDDLEPGTIGSYGQAEGTGCVVRQHER